MKDKKHNYIYKVCQKYNIEIDELIRDAIEYKKLGKVIEHAFDHIIANHWIELAKKTCDNWIKLKKRIVKKHDK